MFEKDVEIIRKNVDKTVEKGEAAELSCYIVIIVLISNSNVFCKFYIQNIGRQIGSIK